MNENVLQWVIEEMKQRVAKVERNPPHKRDVVCVLRYSYDDMLEIIKDMEDMKAENAALLKRLEAARKVMRPLVQLSEVAAWLAGKEEK